MSIEVTYLLEGVWAVHHRFLREASDEERASANPRSHAPNNPAVRPHAERPATHESTTGRIPDGDSYSPDCVVTRRSSLNAALGSVGASVGPSGASHTPQE